MNKTKKIWLNYLLGGVISALLIWGIYLQVQKQIGKIGNNALWDTGPVYLIWLCVLLMPLNIALEAFKWRLLAGSAQQLSYLKALESVLAGIALSIITPNRIGEYPGRILYLKKKNTFRMISVSILGIFAQMLALSMFGFIGLVYFNTHFPGALQMVVLVVCTITTVALAVLFWSFELWMPVIEKIRWLRRFNIYGKLLKRFNGKEQLTILMISMLRLSIYTAQYLIFLKWMNIQLPLLEGFVMSGLFFWIIAVIPSITLVELGERGQISLFLFGHFSENTVGILTATIGVWVINLIVPALIGSLLTLRMRMIR